MTLWNLCYGLDYIYDATSIRHIIRESRRLEPFVRIRPAPFCPIRQPSMVGCVSV